MIFTKKITKVYKNTQILDIERLEIRQGEFVAVVGESGSGKTTLLNILSGLDFPISGEVIIDGENIKKLSDSKLSKLRNRKIGFIFQFFYLQPFLSVLDNIEISAMPNRTNKKRRREKSKQLAEMLGLEDKLYANPSELSGGQIQRVSIARSLLNSPEIIFADEQTGNLDSENAELIMNILASINKSIGTTVVMVTHNEQLAARADRVVRVRDGRIQ